jgi:hypothetical protein
VAYCAPTIHGEHLQRLERPRRRPRPTVEHCSWVYVLQVQSLEPLDTSWSANRTVWTRVRWGVTYRSDRPTTLLLPFQHAVRRRIKTGESRR